MYLNLKMSSYFLFVHVVPGVIGTLQALEAIKIVVGIKCILLFEISPAYTLLLNGAILHYHFNRTMNAEL